MTRCAAKAGRASSWGTVSILVVTFASAPAAAADPGWLSAVSADLATREYAFRPDGLDRIAAPNRAQGLCAAATPDGIEITARCGSPQAAPIILSLRAFGRESAAAAVQRARCPRADGGSARLERGPIAEWLHNAPRGLEHGFTLMAAPEGSGAVVLELAVDGALLRADDPAGRSLLLLDPAGRPALRYAELAVVDATQHPLAARMDPRPGGLRIAIDDTGATYPLTIDPLATTAAWSAESDQAGAALGLAVATAGDVNGDGVSDVLVGAPLFDDGTASDAGAAFLYLGSAAGPAATASWSASGSEAGAGFGRAVTAAGDINGDGYQDVAIGADGCDAGGSDAGCVAVYYGSATGLPAAPSLVLTGSQAGAAFGRFVAGAGDVNGDGFADLAVGAPLFDDPLTDEGKVFVHLGSALGLSTLPAWSATSGQAGAELGAVAGAGDVNGDGFDDLVAGAPRWSGGEADEGKLWLFHGGAGGPAPAASWSIEGDNAGARFGDVVGTAGDVNGDGFADLFAGAPRFSGGEAEEGAAFVYYGSAGSPTGPWTYQPNVAGARAGFTVATAGDLNGDGRSDLVVGLERWSGPESEEGRALAFLGTSGGLAVTPYWSHEINQAGARFASVATSGDVNGDGFSDLLVGAAGFDGGQADEGAAFLFYGAGDAPATQVAWSAQASGGWRLFGQSVAAAGDIDGDGYGDVIVGDPSFLGGGGTAVGLAALYPGAAGGPAATPSWTASGLADSAFGISVAGAGDVDGDGYPDVIVGASDHSNSLLREGAAFLYRGGPAGLTASPAWSVEGELAGARLGWSVAGAGDVNGDGYGDVAIGAPDHTPDGSAALLYAGRVRVYHGGPTGLGAIPAWTHDGDEYASDFGYSVASAGDVDGDGASDLVVGDPLHLGTFLGGQSYLFTGGPGGLSSTPSWTVEGEDAVDDFGRSVATAGDVNRDGYSDVLVGANGVNVGVWRDAGRAYLFLGGPSGPAAPAAWTWSGANSNASLGRSVASAGDTNGDGYSDVIVGAPNATVTRTYEGQALLFLGSASGLGSAPAWSVAGGVAYADLGMSVASGGDINGDGFSDPLVGDPDAATIGAAYAWFGGGTDGLTLLVRQQRTDGTPLPLLDLTLADSAFDALVVGRTPAGRGRIRLVVETKLLGVPFDGTGVVAGALTPTGAPGSGGSSTPLAVRTTGLASPAPYAWRARLASPNPLFPGSRWLSVPGNGPLETDFRTVCGAGSTWYLDADGDGYGDALAPPVIDCVQPPGYVSNALDCNDADASAYASPGEVGGLTAERLPAAVRIAWASQDAAAGPGTGYDAVAGDLDLLRTSGGFAAATCRANDLPDTPFDDATAPPTAGAGEYLLLRAQNGCGAGTYGDSTLVPDPRDTLDAGGPCP